MKLQLCVGHLQVPLVFEESNVQAAAKPLQNGLQLLFGTIDFAVVDCTMMENGKRPSCFTHAVSTVKLVDAISASTRLQ